MKKNTHIFYYSRKKLGLYLLFNIVLLTLAVLFTLTIFPDYPAVYYFAIGSCFVSLSSALLVFLVPMRLATITPLTIKIDRAEPLNWSDINKINKIKIGKGIFAKTILKLETGNLYSYHLNLIQKITKNSEFGAFSIPLYAMSADTARDIERVIRKYQATDKKIRHQTH